MCINYLNSRTPAEELVEGIAAKGGQAIAIQADVGDATAVEGMFRTVDERLGRVTALVNNAGGYDGVNRIADMTPAQLMKTFSTNTFSYFYCAREALHRMSKLRGGNGGAIVNVSSRAATFGGLLKEAHYAASKGAVDTFTISLAREAGPEGIRVTGVRPGPILTDIHDVHGARPQRGRSAQTGRSAGRANPMKSPRRFCGFCRMPPRMFTARPLISQVGCSAERRTPWASRRPHHGRRIRH